MNKVFFLSRREWYKTWGGSLERKGGVKGNIVLWEYKSVGEKQAIATLDMEPYDAAQNGRNIHNVNQIVISEVGPHLHFRSRIHSHLLPCHVTNKWWFITRAHFIQSQPHIQRSTTFSFFIYLKHWLMGDSFNPSLLVLFLLLLWGANNTHAHTKPNYITTFSLINTTSFGHFY